MINKMGEHSLRDTLNQLSLAGQQEYLNAGLDPEDFRFKMTVLAGGYFTFDRLPSISVMGGTTSEEAKNLAIAAQSGMKNKSFAKAVAKIVNATSNSQITETEIEKELENVKPSWILASMLSSVFYAAAFLLIFFAVTGGGRVVAGVTGLVKPGFGENNPKLLTQVPVYGDTLHPTTNKDLVGIPVYPTLANEIWASQMSDFYEGVEARILTAVNEVYKKDPASYPVGSFISTQSFDSDFFQKRAAGVERISVTEIRPGALGVDEEVTTTKWVVRDSLAYVDFWETTKADLASLPRWIVKNTETIAEYGNTAWNFVLRKQAILIEATTWKIGSDILIGMFNAVFDPLGFQIPISDKTIKEQAAETIYKGPLFLGFVAWWILFWIFSFTPIDLYTGAPIRYLSKGALYGYDYARRQRALLTVKKEEAKSKLLQANQGLTSTLLNLGLQAIQNASVKRTENPKVLGSSIVSLPAPNVQTSIVPTSVVPVTSTLSPQMIAILTKQANSDDPDLREIAEEQLRAAGIALPRRGRRGSAAAK